MSKRKTLWKRETPCPVCQTPMVNHQFITKSQTIHYDGWMVAHTQPVGEYGEFPDTLKTTVCPGCLTASNEYNYGVDDYTLFAKSSSRHEKIRQLYWNTVGERFKLLADEFERYEAESETLDLQQNRPAHTRTRATLEKVWQNRDTIATPFFTRIFEEPRDWVAALACFALDRHFHWTRIAFDNGLEPPSWEEEALRTFLFEHFENNPLDMKAPKPRFYLAASNCLQSVQFLERLTDAMGPASRKRHEERLEALWRMARDAMRLSLSNEDPGAVPCELREGGMNLVMAKLHFRFGEEEEGKKCLRAAKVYADNRIRHVSTTNQQNFVNETEDLYKKWFSKAAAAAG